jgi:hypothetical protein
MDGPWMGFEYVDFSDAEVHKAALKSSPTLSFLAVIDVVDNFYTAPFPHCHVRSI